MATTGKPITCKAAVVWNAGDACSIETIEVSPPKEGEIRIKMSAVGICYSDISLGKGLIKQQQFPVVPGHEGIGVVESVGTGVTGFQPGDTVIPLWSFQCGDCRWCKRGRRNLCQGLRISMTGLIYLDKTRRITCNNQEIGQSMGLGLFSEYVVLPEKAAVKVPPTSSPQKIAAYGCCVPTGYGAAVNSVKVDEGSTVAVFGLGAIGLCALLGCRDAKASRIIGVDINPDKFAIGKKFGCTEFVNPQDYKKPISAVLKDITEGVGVDFSIVCVGNMEIMEQAVEALSPFGSECVIVGLNKEGMSFPVEHMSLIRGNVVRGTWCGDCYCKKELPELVQKYLQGTMPTDELVTEILPLEDINKGYDLLKAGKAIRTVIKF